MAHARTSSGSAPGGSHSVSLKVLRLSRPSLAPQTTLPPTSFGNGLDIPPEASLGHSSVNKASSFPLTPVLTLPAAFGAAYVGETFACTLCANNELTNTDNRTVSGVRITAELQTPSNRTGHPLDLQDADDATSDGDQVPPGGTMQRTLRHKLKEEGPHVLAVTVMYTETILNSEGSGASGGRARTFKKLYQFVSQQLIAVRSKVTTMKRMRASEGPRRWILEAQLENVGETSVVVEKVWAVEAEDLKGRDVDGLGRELGVLKPQDVEQVMFVLEEVEGGGEESAGRRNLAQLNIEWRSGMAEKGDLTTGWLMSRG